MAFVKLELLYEECTAAQLKDRLKAGYIVAAADIGALGYYSESQILDLLGLISPQATAHYPLPASAYAINYAVPPRLVAHQEPDYVAILEAYSRSTLLKGAGFQSTYRLDEILSTDIYGSAGLLVFSKAESPK